jgi:mannose-6-phosphate isomerase
MMRHAEQPLYPLELSLHRIRKAWGGWPNKIGEIWSLSGPPHESIVLGGVLSGRKLTEIVGEFQQRVLGADMELDPREPFPMLLKFISTGENHPIQVHPDDAYTMEKGLPMVGKDKIWYVLHAGAGGLIYLGFKHGVDARGVREAARERGLQNMMNAVPVKAGDLYTVPAGRIHGIGKGVTLFEIQNHSSLTFELFRWNPEASGRGRGRLRLDEALEVLDFNLHVPRPIRGIRIRKEESCLEYLALTPRFFFRRLTINKELDISSSGERVRVFTGLRGSGWFRWGFSGTNCRVQPYQSILVPAIEEDLFIESEGDLEILETSITHMAGETLNEMIRNGISRDAIVGLGGGDYSGLLGAYLR